MAFITDVLVGAQKAANRSTMPHHHHQAGGGGSQKVPWNKAAARKVASIHDRETGHGHVTVDEDQQFGGCKR